MMQTEKNCARCERRSRKKGQRYCSYCAKDLIAEMKRDGYLTRLPYTAERPESAKEDTHETKFGADSDDDVADCEPEGFSEIIVVDPKP